MRQGNPRLSISRRSGFGRHFPSEDDDLYRRPEMTRAEIEVKILEFFRKEFEIENPGMDDDLRKVHEFDSIDAIELLLEIENLLDSELSQEEKKRAMDIRTLNHVIDYIQALAIARQTA
jgi:acyl carrier protein